METVQLQCGHCKKVMSISVQHLGGQVHCPHCRGIVQTQAPAPPPASPPPLEETPPPDTAFKERDSIFAGAEASDAVLGDAPMPKIELPTPPFSNDAPGSAEVAVDPEPAPTSDSELPRFQKPRVVFDSGVLAMYGFIFLIPYAILTTLAILYLVFVQGTGNRIHPLDMLPDPENKGGAKRVTRIEHTHPLADHQKIALGKTIRVGKDGDLEVTPLEVVFTKHHDLELHLRAKNISTNASFVPINEGFVQINRKKLAMVPYSFLESKSGKLDRIYNLTINEGGDKPIRPNEEITLVLATDMDFRDKLAKVANGNDSFTWRLQLRRGFVKHQGKDVSATAVIGIEFTNEQIKRDDKKG